jgi:hypothetical protein
MAARPQQKPQSESGQPGLKVVESQAAPSGSSEPPAPGAKTDKTVNQARDSEAALRRRLHPPRVWPD